MEMGLGEQITEVGGAVDDVLHIARQEGELDRKNLIFHAERLEAAFKELVAALAREQD